MLEIEVMLVNDDPALSELLSASLLLLLGRQFRLLRIASPTPAFIEREDSGDDAESRLTCRRYTWLSSNQPTPRHGGEARLT